MLPRLAKCILLGGLCAVLGVAQAPAPGAPGASARMPADPAGAAAPLTVTPSGFLLRGKPFRILSGELEYARIPRADWRDRLQKVRALGLNAVTVYVFWNLHEPQPGVYDFSGQNDVAAFVREAQAQGLFVILRPGPYVCAEWDLGGYPAWLLRDHNMLLRSTQPEFLAAATRWMHRLGQELAPLQASNGGPILAVQVENEYGSFGHDRAYLQDIYRLVQESGFTGSLLYTADGADVLEAGSLPGVLAAVDFGTGDASRSIALLQQKRPGSPVFAAEYWDGWFDHWGEPHQTTDAVKQEAEIRSMLAAGDSLSLYMVHGGTTFGWMNGANSGGKDYQPDVSSYDYDAPLDEAGRPRPKYFRIRELIAGITRTAPPPVPESSAMLILPPVALNQATPLWKVLPASTASATPLSMEDIGQGYGYILYRTEIHGAGDEVPATLAFHDLHSYARVYLDGRLAGVADRRLGQNSLVFKAAAGKHRLDILVENSGRINFTTALRGERAGLTGPVTYQGVALPGWQITPLPFTAPPAAGFTKKPCTGPCFFHAEFPVTETGDTYLNTQKLSKGVLWVNGHLLGRFWNIGPTGDLFLPGAWLHKGKNELTVLDLEGGTGLSVTGEDHQTYFTPPPGTASPGH